METKTCTGCGRMQPVSEYHKKLDGRAARCKTCVKAAKAKYYAENRETLLAKSAEYNARPEVKAARAEYNATYHAANRTAIREQRAEYYARPEAIAHRAEYSARPEVKARRAQQNADWCRNHPEYVWEKGYRQRAKAYGFDPVVVPFTREALIEKWGEACAYCGGLFQELDHHIPVAHGGHHTLENARPSCVSCNRPGGAVRTTNKPEQD